MFITHAAPYQTYHDFIEPAIDDFFWAKKSISTDFQALKLLTVWWGITYLGNNFKFQIIRNGCKVCWHSFGLSFQDAAADRGHNAPIVGGTVKKGRREIEEKVHLETKEKCYISSISLWDKLLIAAADMWSILFRRRRKRSYYGTLVVVLYSFEVVFSQRPKKNRE